MNMVLVPSLPPPSNVLEIPDDMTPEEQAVFLSELGSISTKITTLEVRAEERARAAVAEQKRINARLAKLEQTADTSNEVSLATVQKALEKEQAHNAKVKWWALSILTTLFTSALVGLVVFYLTSR